MTEFEHAPVLLEEVLELLDPQPGDCVLDGTVGQGGHAVALANRVGAGGQLFIFDVDPANLAAADERLKASHAPVTSFNENFVHAPRRLHECGVRADVALFDLGFSSNQMSDPARGLSFQAEGPLDMRLDPALPATAADLIAELLESELADLIYRSGEEPLSRKIARKLVEARQQQPITTTEQLARIVRQAYGRRAHHSRMHPATRTFMALRIAVNRELDALATLLERIPPTPSQGRHWLSDAARVGIISFHSLEDRLVKRAFAGMEKDGVARRVTRKPVTAGPVESGRNPRSRSAKLRVIRMIPPSGDSQQGRFKHDS